MRPCAVPTALSRGAVRSILRGEEPCLRRATASRAFTTARKPARPPRAAAAAASSHTRPRPARPYHSYSHPPPPGPFNATERALLSAAYAHVPAHGFTPEALALGARDAGYLDISTNLLSNGVFDLIRWHLVTRREALVQKSKDLEAAGGLRTADRVFELTWERLLGNREVVGRWQEVSTPTRRFRSNESL